MRVRRLVRGLLTRCVPRWRMGRPDRHYRAVIFKVDRIGDFVLALGAIRLALEEWGETNCLLIVSALAEPLAEAEFPRTPRLILPPFVGHGRFFSLARAAREALGKISCDVAINLRHQRWDFDELCLSWLHAKSVHVLEDPTRPEMCTERRTLSAAGVTRTIFREETLGAVEDGILLCRELAMHRQLLSLLLNRLISAADIVPRLGVKNPVIVAPVIVSPLGSHRLRDLSFGALLAALRCVHAAGRPAMLVGDPRQAARLAQLAAMLGEHGIEHIAVRTDLSLTEFVGALAAACLVITTESAAAHLATALDRPTVVVLGGGHFGQFAPWRRSDRQVWLTNQMECFGCNWHCIHREPYCVTGVAPDALAAAVQGQLNSEACR